MDKIKVLFVCVYNSARSQMAEALLNNIAGDRFVAESAGMDPGRLLPAAVQAMADMGIDISNNKTKSVFDLYRQDKLYNYVITLCQGAENCPLFPGITTRLAWSFPDPGSFSGSGQEKLAKTIEVRDALKLKIQQWADELKASQ
jgi:arsenate reductase